MEILWRMWHLSRRARSVCSMGTVNLGLLVSAGPTGCTQPPALRSIQTAASGRVKVSVHTAGLQQREVLVRMGVFSYNFFVGLGVAERQLRHVMIVSDGDIASCDSCRCSVSFSRLRSCTASTRYGFFLLASLYLSHALLHSESTLCCLPRMNQRQFMSRLVPLQFPDQELIVSLWFSPPVILVLLLLYTGRALCAGRGLQQDRPLLLHEGPGCLLPCQRPGLVR